MDHTELFDIARARELVVAASVDTDVPATIRAELAAAGESMNRAYNMAYATVGDSLTPAQQSELAAFVANLRENYVTNIKPQTRARFSDSGSIRAQRNRANHQRALEAAGARRG